MDNQFEKGSDFRLLHVLNHEYQFSFPTQTSREITHTKQFQKNIVNHNTKCTTINTRSHAPLI